MTTPRDFTLSCPFPIQDYPRVLLAHGGGGKLMHQLIGKLFLPAFHNPLVEAQHDATVLEIGGQRVAFTTDSYVVRPLFFPGGDLGSLAVHGTVNDLAMAGARPLYLSAAFIIEEGLPMETLWKIVSSMQHAAQQAGVQIVTGDTKVVDKGKGDGLFINTAGVGLLEHQLKIGPQSVQPGDAILVNGDVGRHGMAIMAVREGLEFESAIESDSAPLAEPVLQLLRAGIELHCLRDLTRGGLTSVLNEITESAGFALQVEEKLIPVREDVRAACEILGLDPLQVACEGRFAAFVPERDAERALAILRAHPASPGACRIGKATDQRSPKVLLKSAIGAQRILDMSSGEQLPRIC
ncbi:MAG TPA: hydrogenase expression/formation protein HypE [Candidatus Paceibacterota bacterium]|nr:hydrogenase expression/formation protein HypE [Verrucomicrobiota bacterium]HSA11104.1 hydrogenase expression/formation protein HypE [Candidatus Paceibacterota bacterium]